MFCFISLYRTKHKESLYWRHNTKSIQSFFKKINWDISLKVTKFWKQMIIKIVSKIVIPRIQRDYAQGRADAHRIRKRFLDAIYDAIIDKPITQISFYSITNNRYLLSFDECYGVKLTTCASMFYGCSSFN